MFVDVDFETSRMVYNLASGLISHSWMDDSDIPKCGIGIITDGRLWRFVVSFSLSFGLLSRCFN
jgi:hypothetical protein